MAQYQGPVRPGTNERTFRETGQESSNSKPSLPGIPPQQNPFKPPSSGGTVKPDSNSPTGYSNVGGPVSPAPTLRNGGNRTSRTTQPTDNLGQAISSPISQPVNPATDIQRSVQQPRNIRDILKIDTPNQNLQRLNIQQFSRQTPETPPQRNFINRIVDRFKSNRQTRKEERLQAIQDETYRLRGGVTNRPFVQSGRGTQVTQKTTDFTNQEIVQMAGTRKVSQESAISELAYREQQKYGQAYNNIVNTAAREELLKAQEDANAAQNQVQTQVNRFSQLIQQEVNQGRLSKEEADKRIIDYTERKNKELGSVVNIINDRSNKNIKDKAEEWVNSTGRELESSSNKYLDRISDKISLNKNLYDLTPTLVGGAIIGAVAAPLAGGAGIVSTGLRTGGQVLLGAGVGSEVGKLTIASIEGRLTPTKIANALIPFATITAGGIAGAKGVTGFKGPVTTEVQNAIARSDFETKIVRGITSETELARIGLSETQLPQIQNYIRQGAKISEIEIKPVPKGGDKIIINKALDGISIKGVQVEVVVGNRIERFVVANIQAERGVVTSQLGIFQRGSGLQQPSGISMVENVGLVVGKKGPIGVSKTLEISKTRTDKVLSAILKPDGTIEYIPARVIIGKGVTFQRGKAIADKGKILSEKDISKVASSDFAKLSRQSEFTEKQILTNTDKKARSINLDTQVIGSQSKYKTIEGLGVSRKVEQSIDFSKVKLNKEGYVDFSYLKLPETKITKPIETSKPVDLIKPQETKLKIDEQKFELPKADLSSEVGLSLEQLSSSLNIKKFNLNIPKTNITTQKLKIDEQKVKEKDIQFNRVDIKPITLPKIEDELISKRLPKDRDTDLVRDLTKTLELQSISTAQVQAPKINQALKIEQINIPQIKIPKVPTFDIPGIILPGVSGTNGGSKKEAKRIKKRLTKLDSDYTASLSSAFLQDTPIKISKKKFKELQDKTYSGFEVRPVVQIVDDKEMKKLKKQLKKLNI